MKEIKFTNHAKLKMTQRGASEDEVILAISNGEREIAQRGLYLYKINIEYNSLWGERFYRIKQVAPVVAEEENSLVIITVYTFYF